jgi:cobalt/nickel transport system permease protein
MHIPDGFLSPPVWATLDVVAVPAIALAARRAQSELESPDDRRIPLLGVMGAFVFAAQMINFPVGLGTSGHLVGGALMAITLGPWAASIVMTAILILQAFIFQDGGIVVLGANVFNMALAGVLAGYLPYRFWGRGRTRGFAIFAGGVLSVAVSACLAMTELLVSDVPVPRRLLWVREADPLRPRAIAVMALGAAVLVGLGIGVASSAPDALQALLAGRQSAAMELGWLRKAATGLAAMMLIYATCAVVGRVITRQRSA